MRRIACDSALGSLGVYVSAARGDFGVVLLLLGLVMFRD